MMLKYQKLVITKLFQKYLKLKFNCKLLRAQEFT